ncbi:glycoside hydrolase family 16 protein [Parafrigoribacterium soli]|uniref:glycoside hydrolase family 16 protein n=1 Tax=Parafrigoribacterium soli TaxID=3144663 RepID=UPI0032ECED45
MSAEPKRTRGDTWRQRLVRVLIAVFAVAAVVSAVFISSPPPTPEKVIIATPLPTPTSTAKALGLVPSVDAGTPATSMKKLAFSDEFNGPTLDVTKWNTGRYSKTTKRDAPFNPNFEGAYYASSQVSQSDGSVILTAEPSKATVNGKKYYYASGLIQSENHFYLTPGTYVETRAKVATCDGCWGAFWAQPSKRWPPELDIFEFFQPKTRPEFNFHFPDGGEVIPSPYGEPNFSYLDQYHVYGLYWDGVEATPYLDGKPYASYPAKTNIPMYLLFNLAVFDGHSPAPGSTMAIDWVRVWR